MGKSKKRIQSYIIDKDKILGKGAFGEVYLCQHQEKKFQCVAKIVSKAKIDQDQYMKKALNQQIQIHNGLRHKNIVEFLDVLETSNNYYIIQEYCENGTLRQLLKNHSKFSEPDALHCLKCLCLGFTQIAKKGVIHRDLKPQNILIKENELKVADFGFAKKMMNHRQLTGTTLGSPYYMAPQLLKGKKYSSKCDVWSVGVIYYELLFGTHPWKGNNIYSLVSSMEKNELYFDPKVSISEQSQIFLIQALQITEDQRLSWLQVFQHKVWSHLPQNENQFNDIAKKWRASYVRAAEKLNHIASKVQIQQLIAAFLQLQVPTLQFQQFEKVMLWLQNVEQEEDVGIMYQLFDKDCNGVIDFGEFTSSFGFNDGYQERIRVIQKLLQKGLNYYELKNEQKCIQQGKKLNFSEDVCKAAYLLISNIQL